MVSTLKLNDCKYVVNFLITLIRRFKTILNLWLFRGRKPFTGNYCVDSLDENMKGSLLREGFEVVESYIRNLET